MIKSCQPCHPHSLTTGRCDCYSHVTDKGAEARRRRQGLFIPGPASPCLGSRLSPPASCLSLPDSLPLVSPLLSLSFYSPYSPAEASLLAGRILPKPHKEDGFCRPRTRPGAGPPHASHSWLFLAPGGGGGGGQGMHAPAGGGPGSREERPGWWTPQILWAPKSDVVIRCGYHFRLPWSG